MSTFPEPAAIAALIRAGAEAHAAGRAAEAEAAYRQALDGDGTNLAALARLALLLDQTGRHAEAIGLYRRALKLAPGDATLYFALAQAQEHARDWGAADASYAEAIRLRPDMASAYRHAAALAERVAAVAAQRGQGETARELTTGAVQYRTALGVRLVEAGAWAAAETAFRDALRLAPEAGALHADLGRVLIELGRPAEAEGELRQAVTLAPKLAPAHVLLANALSALGPRRWSEAETAFEAGLALDLRATGAAEGLRSLRLFGPVYRAQTSAAAIFERHREWGNALAFTPPAFAGRARSGRRLRVGYVSPDFRQHSVAYFFEPLLAHHDRSRIEVFCYAELGRSDATTERLKGLAEHWRSTRGTSDAAINAQIGGDEIDVLVDLAGHTAGNRLTALAGKPAPVIATWLGYPATTGLPAIDWRITDEVADPKGAEAFHTERLWRLPSGFLCYRPPAEAPPVAPLPAGAAGPVTFGSFNALLKLDDPCLECWARVLRSVPGSRLLLKTKLLADRLLRDELAWRFGALGIAPERLVLRGEVAEFAQHLATYAEVDVALDPFPYNGTTTTCEALWMGVPVVALLGDRHSGRVGASLLSRLGLERLVAPDPEAYGEIARALASDLSALARMRGGLRQRMQSSTLCDEAHFAREFERGLETMGEEAPA